MIYEWNQVFFNLIIILPTKKTPQKTHRKTNQLSNHLCIKYPLHITKKKPQQLHVSIKALFKELFFFYCGRIWNTGSRDGRTGTLPSIQREGQTGYTIMSTAPSSSMRRRTSSTNSLCSMQWDTLGQYSLEQDLMKQNHFFPNASKPMNCFYQEFSETLTELNFLKKMTC